MKSGYRKLRIIEEATELVKLVYEITKIFPQSELFGLVSQIRRATVSVPTNIIEGHARVSRKEFLKFLGIANGSVVEVEYLLYLSKELGFIKEKDFLKVEAQRAKVAVYLIKLIKSVRKQIRH
jgi:four helix bundle protein